MYEYLFEGNATEKFTEILAINIISLTLLAPNIERKQ